MNDQQKEDQERSQLHEFWKVTQDPGWQHYEKFLLIQREAIIKALKEANKSATATRETVQALIGELAGVDGCRDIAAKMLARYMEYIDEGEAKRST